MKSWELAIKLSCLKNRCVMTPQISSHVSFKVLLGNVPSTVRIKSVQDGKLDVGKHLGQWPVAWRQLASKQLEYGRRQCVHLNSTTSQHHERFEPNSLTTTHAYQVVLGVAKLGQNTQIENEARFGKFQIIQHGNAAWTRRIAIENLDARRSLMPNSVLVTVSSDDPERDLRVIKNALVDFLNDRYRFGHYEWFVEDQSLLDELQPRNQMS